MVDGKRYRPISMAPVGTPESRENLEFIGRAENDDTRLPESDLQTTFFSDGAAIYYFKLNDTVWVEYQKDWFVVCHYVGENRPC